MKHRVEVLVAGSGNVTGHGIIEALTRANITVAGYDCCDVEVNAANIFCENFQVPRASDPRYADYVTMWIKEVKPRAIIPSNDHDLRALLELRDGLNDRYGIILNGFSPNTLNFLNKRTTSQLFTHHGIKTPELLETNHLSWPYVVRKENVGRGKKFTRLVRTPQDEADVPWDRKDECTFTSLIEGEEYTIDVLCDQNSNPLSIVPRLRRQVTAGIVTFGEIVKSDYLIDKTRELATKCQLKGINCVQCIKNDSGAWFFEVNPRPGSGMSLTTAAGVNMPALWYESLSHVVQAPEPDWGLKMVRYYAGRYFK